jgi:hypothetical protein
MLDSHDGLTDQDLARCAHIAMNGGPMRRTTIRHTGGLRLDLVEPDEGESPFSFQTFCLWCGQMVAMTTYTPADEDDSMIETRIAQDTDQDVHAALMHQRTCANRG